MRISHNIAKFIVELGLKSRTENIIGSQEDLEKKMIYINKNFSPDKSLNEYLTYLSQNSKKPIILLIDEIDSLVGDTLISVLRQIRAGYDKRPSSFPQTIILCGVRDIKDYRIHQGNNDIITGGSAFNIKAESLRLGNFSKEEIFKLYNEHTKYTGQKFDNKCFDLLWEYTEGQPWLVNSLAYEVTFKMKENRDRSIVITKDMIEIAKNRIILSRATHLDQLSDKLKEPRVYRIINSMILGIDSNANDDDEEYCIDLGLIRKTSRGFVISNGIYKEIIPRELTNIIQGKFLSKFAPDWVNPKDETINTTKLLTMFQHFWKENSDIWSNDIPGYKEAAPHLIFQAFLQRVANNHGSINREYGLARKRADLYLKWKSPNKEQRIIFELKIRTNRENSEKSLEKLKLEGLKQTAEYSELCSADESFLIIFDRRENIKWKDKIYIDKRKQDEFDIEIWGM